MARSVVPSQIASNKAKALTLGREQASSQASFVGEFNAQFRFFTLAGGELALSPRLSGKPTGFRASTSQGLEWATILTRGECISA